MEVKRSDNVKKNSVRMIIAPYDFILIMGLLQNF